MYETKGVDVDQFGSIQFANFFPHKNFKIMKIYSTHCMSGKNATEKNVDTKHRIRPHITNFST